LRFLSIVSLLILFLSCKYTPTDLYYKELPEPTPPNFSVDLNEYSESDTIHVIGVTQIHYRFEQDRGEFIQLRILYDTTEILKRNDASGNIVITPEENDQSLHLLTFELTTTSGTGSLADVAGGEYFVSYLGWYLNIDTAPPGGINILPISQNPVSNAPILSWPEYSRANFESYRVMRKISSDNEFRQIAELTNSSSNVYTDQNYIGGNVEYRLGTEGSGFINYGDPIPFSGEKSSIETSEPAGNSLELTWTQNPYPGAFGSYTLHTFEDGYGPNDNNLIFESSSISDTSFTDDEVPFGNTYHYLLNTQSTNDPNSFTLDTLSVTTGIDFPQFSSEDLILRFSNPEFSYLYSEGSLHKITLGGSIQSSVQARSVSASGNQIVVNTGNGISFYDTGMQLISSETSSALLGAQKSISEICVDQSNTILLIQTEDDSVSVIDLSDRTVITTLNDSGALSIREDGSFFSVGESIYKISGDQVTNTYTLLSGYDEVYFPSGNEDVFLYLRTASLNGTGNVSVFRKMGAESGQFIEDYTQDKLYSNIYFNPESNILTARAGSELRFIDPLTGTIPDSYPVSQIPTIPVIYRGGYLFSGTGKMLEYHYEN